MNRLTLFFTAFLFCLFLLPTLSFSQASVEETLQEPSLKGKEILFVYGGWKGHSPKECMELLTPWMESEGATVHVYDTIEIYANEAFMDSMDLIVQIWTMGSITKDQLKGLTRAVRNGAGFAGWHGGAGDAFRNDPAYQYMVGGQWVSHPGGSIDYKVNIVDREDPITQGIEGFNIHSEQYYMHVDPNVKVLATTTFSADHDYWIDECVMPVVWKKRYAKGRIFYISVGHFVKDLEIPEANEILKRGLRWASESKYHPMEKLVHPIYKSK